MPDRLGVRRFLLHSMNSDWIRAIICQHYFFTVNFWLRFIFVYQEFINERLKPVCNVRIQAFWYNKNIFMLNKIMLKKGYRLDIPKDNWDYISYNTYFNS